MPLMWGVILVNPYERKFIQAQMKTTKNILILECEIITKMFFPHFKHKIDKL